MTSRRSRPGRELLGAVAAGLVLWLAGCGDDGGGGSGGDDDASAGADGDGAALYQQSCAACHGEDLRGTDRGPSHLSQVYEPGHHPDESFRVAITQGSPAHHWQFGDMPRCRGSTTTRSTRSSPTSARSRRPRASSPTRRRERHRPR